MPSCKLVNRMFVPIEHGNFENGSNLKIKIFQKTQKTDIKPLKMQTIFVMLYSYKVFLAHGSIRSVSVNE